MSALEVSDVAFAYGARRALDGVSFAAAKGRFTALLGPNGAGKSTLIALLTRLYDLQRGQIRIAGFGLREAPQTVQRTAKKEHERQQKPKLAAAAATGTDAASESRRQRMLAHLPTESM